ncbi:galactosylgalactosylxylosylprotein 3-beta-glucuronosyltransferase P isoform X1 [Anastrepha obliqua]|uniref:galactosylgalactosylxylosylprotein 3-beta-glucuronosyltransferase P isoform X1 n=1 Tax=Anastrepha obliqua TaxID=95512 RepID=UPI00240A6D2C|nr:galactosylgalactosylxylosylprotein 3-beta-glucuronosyltransferase P isoform X1 [Anastrepha obliqua]XP_054732645.1 galactosylgalactosylxylosylprotein 3-beta-glucuronosyltransferase P isoform X1 [Anastrepha obliqua]XP_054732646.1 galactosylgalactosylxylosylprotein 3-beta-glucuronosyltransferase P isoform X1 [Anastrepha obliqua]XP_054732647.1 galactosylgalactosylxylosylprotein 3-beta-glucuronosyltransferase P isoform X1 [Anastrepha obliqua]XP_054732649.1 galactosylgalactosylxylosylprotein 3-bet
MVSKNITYTYTTLQHPFTNTSTTTPPTKTAKEKTRTLHVTLGDEKMAVAKSIKMYLTIFVATTCIYMVLYQYHSSRQPIPQYIKNKDISAEADATAIARKYNSFLWSPMSLFSARQPQQQQQQAQEQQRQLQAEDEQEQQSISEKQSNATTFTTTQTASNTATAPPLSSPLQVAITHSSTSNSSTSSTSASLALSNSSTSTSTAIATASRSLGARQQLPTRNNVAVDNLLNKRAQLAVILNSTTTTTTVRTTERAEKVTANSSQAVLADSSISSRAAAGAVVKDTPPLPPPLYIITPTYKRVEQLAELTRLGYTLKHVPNLLWLVIEDANQTSPLVLQTLNRIGVPFEYFLAPMPEEYKHTKKAKPRGVSNRNRGLDYIRANATSGVFYFADDDNTYDISIFEQMRYTKKVSMWPVGLVTKYGVSSPIIQDGKITGFYDGWIGGRKFPVDMAGFAVSVKFLHERPEAKMPFKPGYEEDGFLKSLAPLNLTEIELLASDCTEILTWHTQTKKNSNASALNMTAYGSTNLVMLDKLLVRT